MALLDLFNMKYPSTDFHELNLDWCISAILQLQKAFVDFSAGNKLIFANPLQHDLTKTYAKNTIVVDSATGTAYLSLNAVGVGVQLDDVNYWMPVFDFASYVTRANQNFTDNYFSGTDRAPYALEVDDWIVLDDVLYEVTADIPADGLFEIGVNIVHFTVEQFLKDFTASVIQIVNQYKNDIDNSELLYRQQLAQDIANTTASLQAQLNLAISGVTVDSEVINARLGADGVTYPTLGDAVRTQVTNLQNNIEAYPFESSPNRPKAKAILDIRFTKYPSTDLRLFAIYRNYTTGGNTIYVISLKDGNDTQYLLLNVLATNYTEVAPETVVPFSVSGGALEGVYRIDWSVFNTSEKFEKSDITKFNKLCYMAYLDSSMTAPGMAANAAAVGERLNNYPYIDKVPNNALKCICDIKFNKYTSRHLRLRDIGRSRVVGGNPIHYIQLADENDNLYNLLNVYDSDYTEPDPDAINSFSAGGLTGTYKIDWSYLTSGSYYLNNSNPEFKQCCYDGYVDSSLSISNAAADAKAVGDAIGNITGANQLKAVCTPVIYAAVGHPFSLYFKNIFNIDDLDDYNVYVDGVVYNDLECRNYGNRLQFSCETAKTYDITIKLRHNLSNSSIEKALQVVINADVQPTIKAIFIGDSFIQSGYITAEIKNMMQNNITMYGTLTFSAEDSDGDTVTGYNEGRGGWGMRHYWGSASRNGFTNAFYNPVTEHFDFDYYITENPTFSDVTDVFIMSGANDYQPNRTQSQNISQFITPYRNIVDSIHDYDPNIKIHCMMPINIAGYGYGFNRTVSESGYRYHFTEMDLAQKLLEEFENDTNVFIVPTHVYLDPVYNMAYTEAPANDRTPIMIDVYSNNVHPNTYGYYAMCDMIYGDIIENS